MMRRRSRSAISLNAETMYREILSENPRNWFVLEKLATCLKQAQRPKAAVDTLELLLAAIGKRASEEAAGRAADPPL